MGFKGSAIQALVCQSYTGELKMKIAIVGSGISGIYAAHYLSKNHEVTLYEANGYLGGHTDTHQLLLDN